MRGSDNLATGSSLFKKPLSSGAASPLPLPVLPLILASCLRSRLTWNDCARTSPLRRHDAIEARPKSASSPSARPFLRGLWTRRRRPGNTFSARIASRRPRARSRLSPRRPGMAPDRASAVQQSQPGRAAVRCHPVDRQREDRAGHRPRCGPAGKVVPIYLQINIGNEPQKHGMSPEDADPARRHRARAPGSATSSASWPFRRSPRTRGFPAALRRPPPTSRPGQPGTGYPVSGLSMGMSHDWPVAVQEGATLIRVGTAIFGSRTS